ncbi:MAG: hypothetical protein AB1806_06200 [Acidobacteriota bacterium]
MGSDDGPDFGDLLFEHGAVQEEYGVEGLVLRGRADAPLHRQPSGLRRWHGVTEPD